MAESKSVLTHNKILQSGKELFLKNGYEKTNLRELCKSAGITTGAFYRHFSDKEALFAALTKNALDSFLKTYESSTLKAEAFCQDGSFENLSQLYKQTLFQIIDLVFSDLDSFRLVLKSSSGTICADFVSQIAKKQLTDTKLLYNSLKNHGISFKPLEDTQLYLLSYAYYSSVFELALQNNDKKTAISCAETLFDFFVAGFKKVHNL